MYSIYNSLIYMLNKTILQECYDTLQSIYLYLSKNTNKLYENTILSNVMQEFIYALFSQIKYNRHHNYILSILKHCLHVLKIEIKYYKLQIYDTSCGKIIIRENNLYDCSLNRYINIIYKNLMNNASIIGEKNERK